ncbi:MAG: hypothetical protein WDN04_23245 [Rhodospirillales bacterium]
MPWGMLLTVLLQRFPTAAAPYRAATALRGDRAVRRIADTALEAAWQWAERAAADRSVGDAAEAAGELRRQASLLERLALDPTQRRRAVALQVELRIASTHRIAAVAQERLIAPLQSLGPADVADRGVLAVLEADARALRRLEAEARRLGAGAEVDPQLRLAAAAVSGRADMAPMDRRGSWRFCWGPGSRCARCKEVEGQGSALDPLGTSPQTPLLVDQAHAGEGGFGFLEFGDV